MRVYLLLAVTAFLCIYAFRNWFVSACGLIVLMAVVQHPDFPTNIAGIQGANPWNMLLACTLLAWFASRRREGLIWDLPTSITVLLFLYAIAVFVSFFRMAMEPGATGDLGTGYLVSEFLINCYKWVIPGLLLFDGVRSRERFIGAMASILSVYFLLAVQVIKWMPSYEALSGRALNLRALKIIQNEVGYHCVNMSMMLAGACWAILATNVLFKKTWQRLLIVAAALVVAYGQALTGGRMGYATWGVVGLSLCCIRWRKYLLLLPVVVIGISIFLPGVVERMMSGFGTTSVSGEVVTDQSAVTSGRNIAWPYVIDKISESPVVGFGRQAMIRTGLTERLFVEANEEFPHPHNAYLECLLDNGMVGFVMIVPFYIAILIRAFKLFLARESPMYSAAGGACLALVLALLIAAVGSQTFYPREGSVGMWAAIGLMLRMSVQREKTSAPAMSEIPSLASAPRTIRLDGASA